MTHRPRAPTSGLLSLLLAALVGPAASHPTAARSDPAADPTTTTTSAAPALSEVVAAPPEPELSLVRETPDEAWRQDGFRLALGYTGDFAFGAGQVPGGYLHTVELRVGARLDADWSLLGTLRYGAQPGTPSILRFSATLEPTLHLTDGLSVTLGAGLGGLVASGVPGDRPADALTLTSSVDVVGVDSAILGSCSGLGVLGLARLDWVWPMSGLWSMGPTLAVDVQRTSCVESTGAVEADTGRAIERRQTWPMAGVRLGWMFGWR
jgi:hypothetical protein